MISGVTIARTAIPISLALALSACFRIENIDLGGDAGAPGDTDDTDALVLRGLDLVIVVDDSGSMAEEQALLATSVFSLVNALVSPSAGAGYEAVDDLRIAVVSTDMGVSADGEIPDESITPASLQSYLNYGDDGAFLETSVGSVEIEDGAIPCDGLATQCPQGWECAGSFCTSDGAATEVDCPNGDAKFAESTADGGVSGLFGTEVACLTSLGTGGCGWEQQLAAAARATERSDQASFFRGGAGLGVVVVTDEDDCSMDDPAALFATAECVDATKLNIACGEHPALLHTPQFFEDAFFAAKGGNSSAVFFAAIVGVPLGAACEGAGYQIGGCLEEPEMQLTQYIDDTSGTDLVKYAPACERSVDGALVTSATPGRRFVELAQALGVRGYVFSICNEDWSDGMSAFAAMAAGALD
jgi:hypothetical protein